MPLRAMQQTFIFVGNSKLQNLTITHKYINSKKADILLIQLSIINGSMV